MERGVGWSLRFLVILSHDILTVHSKHHSISGTMQEYSLDLDQKAKHVYATFSLELFA
jgi:hypothetical protein